MWNEEWSALPIVEWGMVACGDDQWIIEKAAIKRGQSHACMGYAEREQADHRSILYSNIAAKRESFNIQHSTLKIQHSTFNTQHSTLNIQH